MTTTRCVPLVIDAEGTGLLGHELEIVAESRWHPFVRCTIIQGTHRSMFFIHAGALRQVMEALEKAEPR